MTPQEVARKISQFYVDKHNGDVALAKKEILELQITNIHIEDSKCPTCGTCLPKQKVNIKCIFIGKLIGKRGENIEKLQNYLGLKVNLVEDNVLVELIPYEPVPIYECS